MSFFYDPFTGNFNTDAASGGVVSFDPINIKLVIEVEPGVAYAGEWNG